MVKKSRKFIGGVVCLLLVLFAWWWFDLSRRPELSLVWEAHLEGGYTASPHFADFNNDGILDVVVAGGYEGHWGAVHVFDGQSGQAFWNAKFDDEPIMARPIVDVDRDGTLDVFVGCRRLHGDFVVHNGRNGRVLWTLQNANPSVELSSTNFVNAVPVSDLDGDGVTDVLVVQTGGQDELRIPGQLYLVSAATGSILHHAVTPDNRECYSIPAVLREDGEQWLIVGTGGETINGHVFKLMIPSLEEVWRIPTPKTAGGKARAILATEAKTDSDTPVNTLKDGLVARDAPKGFVAGPLVCDLDQDGRHEIVAAVLDGGIMCLNAATGATIWTAKIDGLVANYPTPLPGQFCGDKSLDLVVIMSEGRSSEYQRDHLVWIDGSDGRVSAQLDFGKFQYGAATPLVLDVDEDGKDEVAMMFNNADGPFAPEVRQLFAICRVKNSGPTIYFQEIIEGFSITTPALADVDRDGQLDLLHTSNTGLKKYHLSFPKQAIAPIRYGEFRYSDRTGTGD